MVLIFFFACFTVAGNDMNTFTRLHKDNTIQGGDGQRQAGKAKEEKKKKENKDVLMS
jgi:cyclophilin family peptidyl-prolyl cis-trans isomerase